MKKKRRRLRRAEMFLRAVSKGKHSTKQMGSFGQKLSRRLEKVGAISVSPDGAVRVTGKGLRWSMDEIK